MLGFILTTTDMSSASSPQRTEASEADVVVEESVRLLALNDQNHLVTYTLVVSNLSLQRGTKLDSNNQIF